jgi:transposase
MVADRGYDACAILDPVAAPGGCGHIPTQRDWKVPRSVDPAFFRQPKRVEQFFNALEHFRKRATDYEKSARNHHAAVLKACARLWPGIMSPQPRRR